MRYSGNKVVLEIGFEDILHSVYIQYTREGERAAGIFKQALEKHNVEICFEHMPTYTIMFCFPSSETNVELRVLVLKVLSTIR